jgi:hypothetical protein
MARMRHGQNCPIQHDWNVSWSKLLSVSAWLECVVLKSLVSQHGCWCQNRLFIMIVLWTKNSQNSKRYRELDQEKEEDEWYVLDQVPTTLPLVKTLAASSSQQCLQQQHVSTDKKFHEAICNILHRLFEKKITMPSQALRCGNTLLSPKSGLQKRAIFSTNI